MANRSFARRAAIAPGGLDALAHAGCPMLFVEYSKPGLVNRVLVNAAANAKLLGADAGGRWLEIASEAMPAIGLNTGEWTTWDWTDTHPCRSIDLQVGSGGDAQWWRFSISLFSQFGGVQGLLATASDISDLKPQAADLPEGGQVLSAMLREVEEVGNFGTYTYFPQQGDGVWTGGIAQVWSMAEPKSAMEFRTMIMAIHPEDLGTAGQPDAGEGKSVDAREVRIVRADGEVRYVRSSCMRYTDASGKVERVVRLDRDITELRRAEEELRLAREAASDAARAKDAFLHLMNHTLRTPLNAILGFGEAMRDQIYGPLSSDYRQCIVAVNDSAARLLEIVHDILDLTRLESGYYSLSKSTCDLRQTVLSTVELMGPRVTERNLRLEADCPDQVLAWAEERGLRQILINLIEYATHASRDVRTIYVGACYNDNGEAVMWLRDQGEGLATDIEEALADPLVASSTGIGPSGGSGWFGLTLVKSFLDLHHGTARFVRLADGSGQIEVALPR